MFAPAQNTRSLPDRMMTLRNLRMLEAQPLHRIIQLDIDAEVVGVQLQLVAGREAAILVNIHRERRDRPIEAQLPVAIFCGLGAKIDHRELTPIGGCCTIMHAAIARNRKQFLERLPRGLATRIELRVGFAIERIALREDAAHVDQRLAVAAAFDAMVALANHAIPMLLGRGLQPNCIKRIQQALEGRGFRHQSAAGREHDAASCR